MARTWDDTGMASYNGPRHPEPPGDTSLPLFLRPSTAPTLDREELEALPEARAEAAQAARAKRGIVDYSQRGVDMGPSIYELRERRTVLRSPGGGAQLGGIADSQPYPGSKIGWNSELDVEWEYSPEASSKLMAAATEAVTKADKSIGDLAAALGDRDVAVIKAWEKAGIIPGANRAAVLRDLIMDRLLFCAGGLAGGTSGLWPGAGASTRTSAGSGGWIARRG